MLLGLGLAFVVLLAPAGGDGSYTCRGSALEDLISPEPEESAEFRREVAFDVGWQCNRDAREKAVVAIALFVPVGAASAAWALARRRSWMYP
jgi:hypothetical protein